MSEDDKVCVYHNLENTRIYHQVEPQFIEISDEVCWALMFYFGIFQPKQNKKQKKTPVLLKKKSLISNCCFVLQMAPAVEYLLHSYPDYVTVDSLPMNNVDDKVQFSFCVEPVVILLLRTVHISVVLFGSHWILFRRWVWRWRCTRRECWWQKSLWSHWVTDRRKKNKGSSLLSFCQFYARSYILVKGCWRLTLLCPLAKCFESDCLSCRCLLGLGSEKCCVPNAPHASLSVLCLCCWKLWVVSRLEMWCRSKLSSQKRLPNTATPASCYKTKICGGFKITCNSFLISTYCVIAILYIHKITCFSPCK